MAFNFWKWVFQRSDPGDGENGTEEKGTKDFLDEEQLSVTKGLEIYLQRMAFWSCVRKIGYAVGAVEWETYTRGKKKKAREYWSWNYSPNPNQTRMQFFTKLIGQLFLEQEALIVETQSGHRYVADSFSTENRLSGDIYSNVSARGESVPGTFTALNAIHLTIEGERIQRILTAIAAAEGQLLKSSANNYVRNAGRHGVLNIDDIAEADPEFEETYDDLVNEKFKKYFMAENAVLPLFNGYEYEQDKSSNTDKSSSNTRDIRAMMDDIIELTAQAIGMPASIATGKNITDADFKSFMTHLVKPIINMIAEAMNRTLYTPTLVFSGTYIVPNMGGIRYTDLFDVANPIDKLIGSGAFCINDIRIRLGLDVIDEPWAWQHWMTKNYSSVEGLLTGVDGEETTAEPPRKEGDNEQTE